MDKRKKIISELYDKYGLKIRNCVYNDFLTGLDLKDDVVNRVFEIFLGRNKALDDPDKLKEKFAKEVHFLTIEAIRSVTNNHKIEIKIIGDESIKVFYDKVQYYIKQGNSESEAKNIVRTQESILRHRFVSRVEFSSPSSTNTNNPSDSTEDDREYYDIKPPDDCEKDNDEEFVEKELKSLFAKAQAKCFKSYRKDKGDKNFKILFDFHFNEINVTRLAEKYNLAKARISQITKPGIAFIRECIKCELGPTLSEVV